MQADIDDNPQTFSDFLLKEPLLQAVKKMGYERPTAVQQHAIPVALEHRDILVSAETGSGKTAAFLLPALQYILDNPSKKFGTRVLILTPTRELASQIFANAQQLAEFTELKIGLITGGEDFKKQQSLLKRNFEIVISTPGRLKELLSQNTADLTNLDILVLDEADRMLDMGFSEDVLGIAEYCNSERQTLLFSATLTHYGVIKIADQVLKPHKKVIALNTLHDGHNNIHQQIMLADDNDHKLKLLTWLLLNEEYDKALIFTNTRIKADELREPLRLHGLRVGILHGDMEQRDRNRMMALFREGTINIVTATDLAARGLDISGINLVVNFDVPRNGIDYIHRIGRTGRADEKGLAVSLVNHREWNIISGIERFLKQNFERRLIKELVGSYKGPKKVKTSGQAVGSKNKPEAKKKVDEKVKIRARVKKNIGKRRVPTKPVAESSQE
jgi:superfamily II DNA/RNA helicase